MQEKNISTCNLENCQKCSICDTVCPMMAVNPEYPGPKQAGPDGERYRMKSAEFYDKALKYCLNCKRCEVACPSGVHVADMIAAAKLEHGGQTRPLRDTCSHPPTLWAVWPPHSLLWPISLWDSAR